MQQNSVPMRRRWQDILFGVIATAGLALAVFVALVWTGHFVSDGTGPKRAEPPAPGTGKRAAPAPPAAPRPARTPPAQPVARTASLARVQIVASRGDCWVSAHSGSSNGPALLERVLHEGETVTLRGHRIWLELGAAGNVDVSVNGKERPIPSGTTNFVLG